ncbi:CHAT domain-containing protein [Ephemerocybe angulata]|uniref:CHAT domain-containing protein n=1 Tax=Ephemerocybe angulata TaxID=980116 RepID=A0A8H6HG37_9AGAR|nr:CHAT domain-containing protein [Tulosesus angulatus]
MGQRSSSPVEDGPLESRQLYITDITFESTERVTDHWVPRNLKELWVSGFSSSDDVSFPLFRVSPVRWEVKRFIQLPGDTDVLEFTVKCNQGADVGFLRLDLERMRYNEMQHIQRLRQKTEMGGADIPLTMSWNGRKTGIRELIDVATLLYNRGFERLLAFQKNGGNSELTDAIRLLQDAVDLTPQGNASLPVRLNSLGIVLTWHFQRTGNLCDISQAIEVHHKAVKLTAREHSDLPSCLSNLGNSLAHRFGHTGELPDIVQAISCQERAIELTPLGSATLPAQLNNLGGSLTHCFERTGELSSISQAIHVRKRAVELTAQGHENLPLYLSNLGTSLTCRFKRTGNIADITQSVSEHEKAIELTPHGHTDLPSRLNSLGLARTLRFERTGEFADIIQAISELKEAVELCPQGHPSLASYLTDLGGSFTHRFERMGELTDIADAISARQKAVELTPQNHNAMHLRLGNLGNSLTRRFEQTGELSDIIQAIQSHKQALECTPDSHTTLPAHLDDLGGSFTDHFEKTGELTDIADAISVRRRAVDLTPQNHSGLPIRLTNLGSSLTRRFERTGELADIAEAIIVRRRAVELTPEGHADLPGYLNSLGTSLTRSFERTGDATHNADAISSWKKAVDLSPQGHASQPAYSNNLAFAFHHRYVILSGNIEDLEEALSCCRTAASATVGSPKTKLLAAKHWAHALILHRPNSPEILLCFDTMLRLVSLIAGLEQTVRGRYAQLESTSGLALKAAAAACAMDRPVKALEWLEQGRCLVWTQLNNLRTPLDNLRAHDEALARCIEDTAKLLENAGSSRGQPHGTMSLAQSISLEDEARAQLRLARKWDDLLKRARAMPGFESFLMPLQCSNIMQHLPESGPIVVINMDVRRCDALALLAGLDEPLHIPLPEFSVEKATKYRALLNSQLRIHNLRVREVGVNASTDGEPTPRGIRLASAGNRCGDSAVHRVLRRLWEEVVKPILDALGYSKIDRTTGHVLPRIWWCPTGVLTFLPLHAAGIYQGPDAECIFDYAVSSYTPTVSAITDRVKNDSSIDTKASGLFLTSQPNAPGASSIPGTTKEVQSISERAKNNGIRVQKFVGDEMSVDACLEHMQKFSCIHLACHGSQNAAEPLQSRFLFHQGSLELGTILKSNLKNADLAFLSACQTSTGEEKLSDEAVHLAAGMLAAGYRRVVGTMWSIGDQPAQTVATTFYDYLFARREAKSDAAFDGALSAYALHHAVQQLRLSLDDSEHSFLTWIPFVHFGL